MCVKYGDTQTGELMWRVLVRLELGIRCEVAAACDLVTGATLRHALFCAHLSVRYIKEQPMRQQKY